jgi:hypothetical protein
MPVELKAPNPESAGRLDVCQAAVAHVRRGYLRESQITQALVNMLFCPRKASSEWLTGKNEAAGAADARLCHTRGVWACKDRFIGSR